MNFPLLDEKTLTVAFRWSGLDFLKHLACERMLMGYVNDEVADGESTRLVFTGDAIVDHARQFLEREKRGEINPTCWLLTRKQR